MDMSELEDKPVITDTQVNLIHNLIVKQLDLEADVEKKTKSLKDAEAALRKVQELDLPEACTTAGVELFRTPDGFTVEIKEEMKMSIPAKNKPQCAQWLADHDLEALVKEDVTIPFDKGEREKRLAVVNMLEANGYTDYSVKASMHTNQVKSSLKELREQGVNVPEKLFGIFDYKLAKITKSP